MRVLSSLRLARAADLATPGPLKHAFGLFNASKQARGCRCLAAAVGATRLRALHSPQAHEGKLDSRGFARAFRLREDVLLRRLLKLWDRDAVRRPRKQLVALQRSPAAGRSRRRMQDGEVDFREFIVGIATWESYERGFGRLRLAFRLLDNVRGSSRRASLAPQALTARGAQDNDNLLGREDLVLAAEAWDRALAAEVSRGASPVRGGSPSRSASAQFRAMPVPNPFVVLQRELAETHVSASAPKSVHATPGANPPSALRRRLWTSARFSRWSRGTRSCARRATRSGSRCSRTRQPPPR